MSADDDDFDARLRAAMKTLDAEAPSGYFDALPARTLERLERSMQPSTGTTAGAKSATGPTGPTGPAGSTVTAADAGGGVPPVVKDESSGLHDIRNLAESTKKRIARATGSTPAMPDDDAIATSSAR